MTIPRKIQRTVNYRRMDITDSQGTIYNKTLQNLIEQALQSNQLPVPICRNYSNINQGGMSTQLLVTSKDNTPIYANGCLCGTLLYYDKNKMVPLIDIESNRIYEKEIRPLDDQGNERNLEENPIYFAIKDNHVAYIAPSAHAVRELEEFFTWMTQQATGITSGQHFALANVISNKILDKLDSFDVRGIAFKSPGYESREVNLTDAEIQQEKAKGRKGKRKLVKTVFGQSPVLQAILKAMGQEELLEDLNSENKGNLSISIKFSYLSKDNDKGKEAITTMAKHFGGIDELNPKINLKKGSIEKDQLTVKGELTIDAPNGNLSRYPAFKEISNWLNELIIARTV